MHVSHGTAIVGVLEVSSSLSGVFIGRNGRHGEARCVSLYLVLDGSSQMHRSFELLYIRQQTDKNGADVVKRRG